MPVILLALQMVALVCAALALALPAYVFLVLVWSALRGSAEAFAQVAADARAARRRAQAQRSAVAGTDGVGAIIVS
jgi:hypothetical protein